MVKTKSVVPLHISLEPLARREDVLEHEIRVGVVGVGRPAEATIESDF